MTALLVGGAALTDITNLNIPSCNGGSIRGTIIVPLTPIPTGFLDPPNCEATLENPTTDVEALLNGFITLSSVPLD